MRVHESKRLPVVAIINTTPDVVDMLRLAFETEGFVVVSTFTHAIRDGSADVEAFGRQHQPDVILYDIAPPYKNNWQLFLHVSQLPAFQGRSFVLTSTNPARVQALAGDEQFVWEVVETPYELKELIAKVRGLIDSRAQPGPG
jgi:DNA-binding response OmpR family regulator